MLSLLTSHKLRRRGYAVDWIRNGVYDGRTAGDRQDRPVVASYMTRRLQRQQTAGGRLLVQPEKTLRPSAPLPLPHGLRCAFLRPDSTGSCVLITHQPVGGQQAGRQQELQHGDGHRAQKQASNRLVSIPESRRSVFVCSLSFASCLIVSNYPYRLPPQSRRLPRSPRRVFPQRRRRRRRQPQRPRREGEGRSIRPCSLPPANPH